MDKYPHIRFINEGQFFPVLFEGFDMDRVEMYPWIESGGFSWRATCLRLDINLAPLEPAAFNLYKSSLKFYHAGALKVPTITPNMLPHSEDIVDGQTGLLYDTLEEFEEKLERMIIDPAKRKEIGANAYRWVRINRNLDKISKQALFVYKALCEQE